MLCRKLVSEGVAVLDLWIYHAGDGEGGVEGSVTQLSCTSGMQISGEYIKAWKQKGWGGVGWGGGASELAVGRGAPGGCQLRGVEGWLRRVPWQKRERTKEIVKRSCSTALISNFGLITAALYKSFEISLFKQSADRCQCLFRTNLWLPLQKASESGGRQRQRHTSVRRLLGRHTSSWQMGCAAFKGALVHNIFFFLLAIFTSG